jgi:hypothetical protein
MKIFILMFPMIFLSSMGLRNQGVIVPSGTTQGNSYPTTSLLCATTTL